MGKVATSVSVVPNAWRGDKIDGYITLAVFRACMWPRWLHNPCPLTVPQRSVSGQNYKLLLNPCCLGGPHVGNMAT